LSSAYLSSDNKNSIDRVVDLRAPSKIQFGGELGFLYGKSTGKFGREDVAGYIIGTVGNDKFSITAGVYRQETTFNNPRWRR
jgi:2-keto-4-pentenoate hydratase/2-oxohepta-3-ene-1,7-dioic acid hydratase in catechol pathway